MTELISLTPLDYALVLPFIFLAGLIDSIAGGGGLISLPAYVAAGLPMHTALATNKFSSACGTVFSTARYLHAKMIDLPVALVSAVLALLGSYLGTRAVLMLSGDFLRWLLLVVIPVIAVLTLIRKNFGRQNHSRQLKLGLRLFLGGLAGLLIGFWDGFFGPGTGTFLILVYALLLHYDFVVANGNTKVVNLASNLAALTAFLIAGKVYFPLAVPAAAFGIAGNLIGSKLVVRNGNRLIKPIFVLALVLLLGRIVWDLFSR
ncbi:MAG: TSUP family transporter [Candidatus Cloacimonetes bacterium]|nr:TSUP family transporter [Candidatus Cloacimonadota bacterium]